MSSGAVKLALGAVQVKKADGTPKGDTDMKELERRIKNDPSIMTEYPEKAH